MEPSHGLLSQKLVEGKKPHELPPLFIKTYVAENDPSNLDQLPRKLKSAGVTAFHGVLSAKDHPVVLITPPGFFTYTKVLNMMPATGLWTTVMTKGKYSRDNYDAACPDGAMKRSVLDLFKL